MTDMNIGALAKLAQQALNKLNHGDDYMLSDVHNRMLAAYNRFPEDPVIRAVAFTIEKRAQKSDSGATINQKEISDIYNDCVRLSANTKFREVLGDLLITKIASNVVNEEFIKTARAGTEGDLDLYASIDQELTSSFSSLLDNSDKFSYNKSAQDLGAKYVKAELNSIGFKNTKVSFLGGDKSSLVYSVAFETNNGLTKIAVPVAVEAGTLTTPSVFFDGNSLKELTASNIQEILPNTLTDTSTITRDDGNSLLIDNNVEIPKELAHLAQDFENQVLEASSNFGLDAVRKGKEIVAHELRMAGFKNSQVSFGNDGASGVVYRATIASANGPVKIDVVSEMKKVTANRYMPLVPSCFVHDGIIEDFSKEALHRFALSMPKASYDNKSATAYEYMTMKDLKEELLKCVANNNHLAAEEVLAHIQNTFTEQDFRNVLADYQNFLLVKGQNKSASITKKCSLEIPAGKTSVLPVCGHYHVPMDKVVVGEDGSCKLKTSIKSEMNSSTESVLLSNYKILM